MKSTLTTLLILISFISYSQPGILSPDPHARMAKLPVLFIDSVRMHPINNYLAYIEPKEIADIKVANNSKYPNGAMFITLKDHHVLIQLMADKQLSLLDVFKAHAKPKEFAMPVIYILDDKLLTDTSGVRLPASRVYTVTITRAAEMEYFKTTFPGVLIMAVSTKPPVIYIRGSAGRLLMKMP